MKPMDVFNRLLPSLSSTFLQVEESISQFTQTIRDVPRSLYRVLKTLRSPRIIEIDSVVDSPGLANSTNSSALPHQEAQRIVSEINSMLGDNRYMGRSRNLTHDRLIAQRIIDETWNRRQIHQGIASTSTPNRSTLPDTDWSTGEDTEKSLRKTHTWLPTVTTRSVAVGVLPSHYLNLSESQSMATNQSSHPGNDIMMDTQSGSALNESSIPLTSSTSIEISLKDTPLVSSSDAFVSPEIVSTAVNCSVEGQLAEHSSVESDIDVNFSKESLDFLDGGRDQPFTHKIEEPNGTANTDAVSLSTTSLGIAPVSPTDRALGEVKGKVIYWPKRSFIPCPTDGINMRSVSSVLMALEGVISSESMLVE